MRNVGFDQVRVGQRFTFSPYDGELWQKIGYDTARLLRSQQPGAGTIYQVQDVYRSAWIM